MRGCLVHPIVRRSSRRHERWCNGRDPGAAAALAALGVVYGDIGTSPIYTIQTIFNPEDPHPVPVTVANGEGGILSLITLVARPARRRTGGRTRTVVVLTVLGIFGASLFLADSMITPAISVLSAVEGLRVVEPELESLVIPITVVILVLLFAAQRIGTARVGPAVRAGHDRVVPRHRRRGSVRHRQGARNPAGPVPDLRRRVPDRPVRDRLLRAGRGRARRHRSRGALRRPRTLRSHPDRSGVAAAGVPRVHAVVLRAGRADPRR